MRSRTDGILLLQGGHENKDDPDTDHMDAHTNADKNRCCAWKTDVGLPADVRIDTLTRAVLIPCSGSLICVLQGESRKRKRVKLSTGFMLLSKHIGCSREMLGMQLQSDARMLGKFAIRVNDGPAIHCNQLSHDMETISGDDCTQ